MAAPVTVVPVVTRLRRLLDESVAAGTLGTGAKIPTERELCDTLQASRTAVRGALAALEPERRRGYECSHGEIVEALVERDPDAARTHMRGHLIDVRTNLLGAP